MESGPYFKAIKKNALIFYKNVSKNPSDFVIHLYSEDVITSKEKKDFMEKLAEGKSSQWICGELLDYLEVRNDTHSEKVIGALRKSDNRDVADAILKTYNELTGQSTSSNSDPLSSLSATANNVQTNSNVIESHSKATIIIKDAKQVARILANNEDFINKWREVFYELPKTTNADIANLSTLAKVDGVTPYVIASTVIKLWMAANSTEATVEVLCKTLVSVGLRKTSDEVLQEVEPWKSEN